MGIMAICFVWRTIPNDGLDLDECRLVGARLGVCDGFADGSNVRVSIFHFKYLPAIRLETLADVFRETELGVSIDGDPIVVPECYQLPKAKMPSICARLM